MWPVPRLIYRQEESKTKPMDLYIWKLSSSKGRTGFAWFVDGSGGKETGFIEEWRGLLEQVGH